MLVEAVKTPILYRWPGGEVRLIPNRPVDLPADRARRLLDKAPGKVRVVEPGPVTVGIRPGVWVEWLSPALPKQRGEVLAVHPDGTFEVFHPLTEILCRLPVGWITAVFEQPPDEPR